MKLSGCILIVWAATACTGEGARIGRVLLDEEQPTAEAGPEVTLVLPETHFELSGRATHGSPSWEQVGGDTAALLLDPNAEALRGIAPEEGRYDFRLSVTHESGRVASDVTSVFVLPATDSANADWTALDHLLQAKAPIFKAGHSLPPLTVAGTGVSEAINRQLAERWGFALSVTVNALHGVDALLDEGSRTGRLVAAAGSDPQTYPLALLMADPIPSPYDDPDTWDFAPESTWLHDAQRERILRDTGAPILSPLAPESFLQESAQRQGRSLATLTERTPVSVVISDGLYGLDVPAIGRDFWQRDPDLVLAQQNSGLDWAAYWSRVKARHESIVRTWALSPVRWQTAPFYVATSEGYGMERGRWSGWPDYIARYEDSVALSSIAIPGSQAIFGIATSGWTGEQQDQGIPWDLLTQALNTTAGQIELGVEQSYPSLSIGLRTLPVSEPEPFMGFVKAYFTLGALGAVVIVGGTTEENEQMLQDAAVGKTPPAWLAQLMIVARVQALFSHVEDILRNGQLLKNSETHPYDVDSDRVPLYELLPPWVSNGAAVRVVARKERGRARWLITAWASGGEERSVSVEVPNLGEVRLEARVAGSVYIATLEDGEVALELLDPDAMDPTAQMFE